LKQLLYRVAENRILWANVQLLTFDAPELARVIRPGQCALARDPTTFDPYLRRMLWLYQIEGEYIAFTLQSRDPLAARARVGDVFDLLAPIGHAIEFDASARHILLIGEGMRVVPLVPIAHDAVARGREVVLAHHTLGGTAAEHPDRSVAKPKDEIFPAHLLSPEIEYRTDGEVLDTELVAWADAVVGSGSENLYRALADAVRAVRYRLEPGFARVLVDMPMPCGTGACYACAVETARGIQLACVDGPSFDLSELENRRV